jgi:hypothetical protein
MAPFSVHPHSDVFRVLPWVLVPVLGTALGLASVIFGLAGAVRLNRMAAPTVIPVVTIILGFLSVLMQLLTPSTS